MFTEALIKDGLQTFFMGQCGIFIYDEIKSTNDIAYMLAEKSSPEGTIVIAESQSGGRGRRGRKWISFPGQSLSFSVILKPEIPIESAAGITLVMAVSLSDTLHDFSVHKHSIKWPNDILINSKKISGILTELKTASGRIDFIIAGTGINIGTIKNLLPPELHGIASSIYDETGIIINRINFMQKLLLNIENRYKEFISSGLEGIISSWKENSDMAGKRVSVTNADGVIEGTVTGINESGSLVLETGQGRLEIISGEVSIL